MKISILTNLITPIVFVILMTIDFPKAIIAQQEPLFELPVQLIGFPVIIAAVRFANFFKKLSYAVNPKTYQSKSKRSIQGQDKYSKIILDPSFAEKQILSEFGLKACVLEEPCIQHATKVGERWDQPDWNDILRNYKVQSTGMKQWYLLSVFLGDVIRDVPLCKQLAKRLECRKKP